jgi:hypothetical protein
MIFSRTPFCHNFQVWVLKQKHENVGIGLPHVKNSNSKSNLFPSTLRKNVCDKKMELSHFVTVYCHVTPCCDNFRVRVLKQKHKNARIHVNFDFKLKFFS